MNDGDVLEATPPALSMAAAGDLLRAVFGVEGTLRVLVSERDQNVAVTNAEGNWVLKISNSAESRGVVEMEVAAVEHIAAVDASLPVPRARPTRDG
jgi:hydroxylysine kinase